MAYAKLSGDCPATPSAPFRIRQCGTDSGCLGAGPAGTRLPGLRGLLWAIYGARVCWVWGQWLPGASVGAYRRTHAVHGARTLGKLVE